MPTKENATLLYVVFDLFNLELGARKLHKGHFWSKKSLKPELGLWSR
jgi:hypothetical protein